MQRHGRPLTSPRRTEVDIDLTDEQALLCADTADRDPSSTRAALAALRLETVGGCSRRAASLRLERAVFAATGDRHLAGLLTRPGTAR